MKPTHVACMTCTQRYLDSLHRPAPVMASDDIALDRKASDILRTAPMTLAPWQGGMARFGAVGGPSLANVPGRPGSQVWSIRR